MNESGIFDAAGMCDQMIRILNEITIQGINNARRLYLVAQGLETLRDTFRRGGADGQGDTAGREDV